MGRQKSADGIVGRATKTEGRNIMMRAGASNFDDEGDADRTTEMSETDQGGIRRKRREPDAGASSVTTRRASFNPEGLITWGQLSHGSSTPEPASPSFGVDYIHHNEPPYTEPFVRWCGRTAGVNPPPTRSDRSQNLLVPGNNMQLITSACEKPHCVPYGAFGVIEV